MKNEMNEIPTPETNAAIKTIGLYRGDEMDIIDPEFARDLERRLTVAREALQAVSDAGGNYCDLLTSQGISEKALTLTAPKQ